jgi:hypothetical protein
MRGSIEAFIAAWNETDPAKRMALIERGCAEDVALRTPGRKVDGRAQLDALITDYQKRRPGERAALSSTIDIQGNIFRYTGVIEGAAVPRGDTLDTGECDDDGRIRVLLTFVGSTVSG